MSQADRSDVENLDLVEARVHLAAAQYHNSLANGKLIPHPPSAPRSRPASAGAQRPARPWSAQSAHSCPSGMGPRRAELLEAQRMDSATDALAVLLGPWGNCCYQAPPGIITTTLHDIADMLRVSATRRDRRRHLIMNSRQKFLPRSPESLERLHASIIGRSLGRSFANVLLLTKVLMAFREALHTSELHTTLTQRTRWLQSEKAQPDQRCLDFHFYTWQHCMIQSAQNRAAEEEILRGRETLVEVYTQGREELSRAVDSLYVRYLQQLLFLCLSSWRDAVRLITLEGYGYHLSSTRERTPQRVDHLFLSQVQEASLMICLVCWAAGVALLRQGRLLKETEGSLQEIVEVAEHRQEDLQSCWTQKEHLSQSSRQFVSRCLQHAERQLVETAWCHWLCLMKEFHRQHHQLQVLEWRKEQRTLREMLQVWRLDLCQERQQRHSMRQGCRAVARWEEQQRWLVLSEWAQVVREQKAEEMLRLKGERRRIFAERRFHVCSTQHLCWIWDAWRSLLAQRAERLHRLQRAMVLGEERLQRASETTTLRVLSSWYLHALQHRQQTERREVERHHQRQLNQVLQHADSALQRCEERSFHCRLLCEWRLLVVQRKTRKARYQSSVNWVTSKEDHLKEMLLSTCVRFWHGVAEQHGWQRAKVQALRATQQEMHLKTLDALRRRQEAEDDAIQQWHFSAWHQELLKAKTIRAEKDKAMTQTFGQLLLDEEMLRSKSFYQWRDLLHHARQDALHQAAAMEAEERMKVAHEKKLQVMRQAFRSSSEALMGAAFLGWNTLTRHAKKHTAAAAKQEQLNLRRSMEFDRFLTLHCFNLWHHDAAERALEWRMRHKRLCMAEELLDVWPLRHLQGVTSVESKTFQAQLLELWRQVVLWDVAARRWRKQSRAQSVRMCEEQLVPVGERALSTLALHHWHQLCLRLALLRRATGAQERQRGRVTMWLCRHQRQSALRCLWDAWRQETWERRHQQRVAASCQNTREVQLHVRDRMLQALSCLLEELDFCGLELLFFRWRHLAEVMKLQRWMKEKSYRASQRFAQDDGAMWCTWTFFTWANEASQQRHGRISAHLDRQVSGARVVQSQMAAGWRKANVALGHQQLKTIHQVICYVFHGWSYRCAWKKRHLRQLSTLLYRCHNLRAQRRWLWRWQVTVVQEKSANRAERSQRHGDVFIGRLRHLWLLQQTFRSWQHARAYEELFRILSDTQADLAQAAEATALAETAAVAAQQRNQQVTVRVVPSAVSASGWTVPEVSTATRLPMATRVAHVEEENGQQFRAPVVSLQKDIQRHYAQRLQDLQTRGGLKSVPKTCSFEVNFAQGGDRGTGSPPARMEAWRSP